MVSVLIAGLTAYVLRSQIGKSVKSEALFDRQLEASRLLMRIGYHVNHGRCPVGDWPEFAAGLPDLQVPPQFTVSSFTVSADDILHVEILANDDPEDPALTWELPFVRKGAACAADLSRGRMKISPSLVRLDERCVPVPAWTGRDAWCGENFFLLYDVRSLRIACCPIPE